VQGNNRQDEGIILHEAHIIFVGCTAYMHVPGRNDAAPQSSQSLLEAGLESFDTAIPGPVNDMPWMLSRNQRISKSQTLGRPWANRSRVRSDNGQEDRACARPESCSGERRGCHVRDPGEPSGPPTSLNAKGDAERRSTALRIRGSLLPGRKGCEGFRRYGRGRGWRFSAAAPHRAVAR